MTLFPAPADFIEADRRERTNQGVARHQREQQRQHMIAEGQSSQKEADNGIDDGQKDQLRRRRQEITDALCQRIFQIREPDLADNRNLGDFACAGHHVQIGHCAPPKYPTSMLLRGATKSADARKIALSSHIQSVILSVAP